VGDLFSLEIISFVVQKFLNFMQSHLSILSLSCWAPGVLLRNSLPIPIVSRVFPALSCINFRILGLISRSLIHFELILVQDDRHGSVSVFYGQITIFPSNICWRGCLFSIIYFSAIWFLTRSALEKIESLQQMVVGKLDLLCKTLKLDHVQSESNIFM
jgi:hypothetical protein